MARLPRNLDGASTGALVGAVGGLVFVLVNAPSAGHPWTAVLRIAGLLLFTVAVAAVLHADRLGSGDEPTAEQLRAYWWIVAAEVVAIPVGSVLLTRVVGWDDAGLPWVAVVLGVHFLGFARYFPGAGFLLLGAVTTALGVVGLVLAATGADRDAVLLVAGVVTGFVLLGSVLNGVRLGRRTAA